MKGQFFIVAAIIMVIGIVSVVNTLSIPKEVKEVKKSQVRYFLKSIKNTLQDLYANWPYPREHRVRITLRSYGCNPYLVSVKSLIDFPDEVDSGSILVTEGYEVLSDQALWEDLEGRIGYVVFPTYLGCESKEIQVYYNLLGESWEEMEPEQLLRYTETAQQIEVKGVGYRALIDKTHGGSITVIQMLGGQDMITKVESLYRCNGTSFEQYNSDPLIDVLYSGPVLLVVRIRGNHGISTRESFTQYVYFYPERIEIREVGSVAKTIYCDPSQKHTYGHLVQLNGSPIYTENGWIEYNYGEYGLAILKNDSYFESFDLSTTYAYLNAWDSASMTGSKEYWLTLYPHPGGSEKVMDYDSKLRNLVVEVGGEEGKDSLVSLYKNTLSDFMGGFGYLVSISREKGEIYENYSGQPDWYEGPTKYLFRDDDGERDDLATGDTSDDGANKWLNVSNIVPGNYSLWIYGRAINCNATAENDYRLRVNDDPSKTLTFDWCAIFGLDYGSTPQSSDWKWVRFDIPSEWLVEGENKFNFWDTGGACAWRCANWQIGVDLDNFFNRSGWCCNCGLGSNPPKGSTGTCGATSQGELMIYLKPPESTPAWRKQIYVAQDRKKWPVVFRTSLPDAEDVVITDEYGNIMPSQLHAEAEYPYEAPDEHNVLTYHFDEGSGSTAHDSSGNGNDGTLYYYQVSSTADVADTNSTQCVDDDSLSTSDDFYNGWTFKATSGAAAGQTTTIADYDYVNSSYRVLYFSTELTGFSQGDSYELYLDQEGPDWVTGKFNGALEFDGQNDYVQRGGVFDPSSTSFTLEAWFMSYSPSSEPSRFILAKTSSMGTIYIRQYYGKVYGAIVGNYSNPDSQSIIQGGSIEPGRWYHVTMTYDKSTGEHKLYLNSKLIGTNVKNITDWSNLPGSSFYVGAYWSGASPSSFWNGLIDEVRVYTRVLSGEEIKEHYESKSLLSILGSGKYYVYYDNKSIIHAEGSDLSFDESDLEVSNSFIEWDFDDYYFSYEGSPNWFASANKWYTFNGTHEAFNLSNFVVLESGPAAIKIGAQALNVHYNFTIFAFNPFILVEVSGPERVRFGPFWSINGDDDYYVYFQGEETGARNISYEEIGQERYVWFGKRDEEGALIAFLPYSELYPGKLSAGTNFMWVEVQGDKDSKVYFLPDEFSSWEYDYWKESFEGGYVFLDELEKVNVNLVGSRIRVSAEVS